MPAEKSPVSILFLSDGAQTRGLLQPLQGAALAKQAGFPVYTIALGTPDGVIERGAFGGLRDQDQGQLIPVPPDPDTLREIAEMTGGEFSEARTAESLEDGVREPRLAARPRARPERGHVAVRRRSRPALLVLAGLVATVVSPRLP